MSTHEREELFGRWFRDHQKLLFRIVRTYAPAREDQEDLFQEILLHLWSSIPSFQGKAKETTWIYRVALNTALVYKRAKARKRKQLHRVVIDLDQASDARQNSCDSTQDQEVVSQLYEAIGKLQRIDRSIILMHLDGLSYHEMAEILGISKGNAGVRLNRAKRQLAPLLRGLVDDL